MILILLLLINYQKLILSMTILLLMKLKGTTRLTENLIYPTGAKHDTDILKIFMEFQVI